MKKMTAVGLGELLFDVVDNTYHLGGAPANFAWHCAQLELNAYAVAAVGQDPLGKKALSMLGHLADYAGYVASENGRIFATGCVKAQLDSAGRASYSFDEDCAFDHLKLSDTQLRLADNCDLVCFGTLCQRHQISRSSIYTFLSHAKKALKIFDVNLRGSYYSKEIIKTSLSYCNLLKVSDEELTTVCSMLDLKIVPEPSLQASILFDFVRDNYDLAGLILTKGSEGSEVFYKNEHSKMTPPEVDLSDTIGAGDSFDAAMGVALIRGATLADAHAFANEVSAFVCSKAGAMVTLDPIFVQRLKSIAAS